MTFIFALLIAPFAPMVREKLSLDIIAMLVCEREVGLRRCAG